MGSSLTIRNSSGADDRELVAAVGRSLDRAYGRFVQTARKEWERRFGGFDPADACVRVRITGARGRYLTA
jgi:hypothetical protein